MGHASMLWAHFGLEHVYGPDVLRGMLLLKVGYRAMSQGVQEATGKIVCLPGASVLFRDKSF